MSDLIKTQYPVFVYGTLRHGESNYHLLEGRTVEEVSARVNNMVLYALKDFPMMMESSNTVEGELMTIEPSIYDVVMADLDVLEDYDPVKNDGMYFRVQREVILESGACVTAWLYLGNPLYLSSVPHDMIEDGNWCRFRREHTNA